MCNAMGCHFQLSLDISRRCISSWYTCVSCHWYDNHQSTEEYFKDLTLKWTTYGKIGNTISEQQKLSQKIVGPFNPNNPLHASMNKQWTNSLFNTQLFKNISVLKLTIHYFWHHVSWNSTWSAASTVTALLISVGLLYQLTK